MDKKYTIKEIFKTDITGIDIFTLIKTKMSRPWRRDKFNNDVKKSIKGWGIFLKSVILLKWLKSITEFNPQIINISTKPYIQSLVLSYREIKLYPTEDFFFRRGGILSFYELLDIEEYKTFFRSISISDSVLNELLIENFEVDSPSYSKIYDYFLNIINSILDVNIVILIFPFTDNPNPEEIPSKSPFIVSPNFDIEKDTYGLKIESDLFKEGGNSLKFSLMTFIKSYSQKLIFDFNFKTLNSELVSYKEKTPSIQPTKLSRTKPIELCNGEQIKPDNYFGEILDVIKIEGIKEGFNNFLLEPHRGEEIRKSKMFSFVTTADGGKTPSRFVGYFKGPSKSKDNRELKKCEILWEIDWEKEYVNSENFTNTSDDIIDLYKNSDIDEKEDEYDIEDSTAVNKKLNKYIRAFNKKINKIKIPDDTLKVFNVLGDGNCLFYATSQILLVSDIEFTDRNEIFKPKYIFLDGVLKPIYERFAVKLRNLVVEILRKGFTNLHKKIKTHITKNPDISILTEYPNIESDPNILKAMKRLFLERLAVTDNNEDDDEDTIHNKILEYIENISVDTEYGSNLELKTISSFFNVDIKIIVLEGSSDEELYTIDRTLSRIQFPVDGIVFNESDNSFGEYDSKLFLALTPDKHYMSVIPNLKLTMTSYNYLFQKGVLHVGIGKQGAVRVSISDFHEGGEYINDIFLEETHNYIQWLFPNTLESLSVSLSQKYIYNNKEKVKAPVQLKLTKKDIDLIKNDSVCKFNSIKSLVTIMKFFGFIFVITSGEFSDINNYETFMSNISNISLEKLADADMALTRLTNLKNRSHNYNRITRILKYFKLIGLKKINRIIMDAIKFEIFDSSGLLHKQAIKDSYNNYWKKEL